MDLVNFSHFILSYLIVSDIQTVRRFSMRTHLSHNLHHFTNTCLPHGEPCFIKLKLILDSSFLCCAWLCCHTHAHHTCSMLETTNKAKSICSRLSTRQHKPLTRGGVEWVCFRNETPRESDWGCQSIPWSLYYHIVCTCWYQIYQYYLGQA